MENPQWEDFRYVRMSEFEGNMFGWFGNGLTVAQEERGKTTQYLDGVDIPPIINHDSRPTRGVGFSYFACGVSDEKPSRIAESLSTTPS